MSLKLFYSQLNLHSSALHECLKRCSPAMQACLETFDDTLYYNTTDCSVAKRLSQSCKHSNSAPQCYILMFVRVSNDVPQPCKHAWKHTMIPCITIRRIAPSQSAFRNPANIRIPHHSATFSCLCGSQTMFPSHASMPGNIR